MARAGARRSDSSAYRAGLAIAERLAALDPSNADWQRDLSVSHDKIGDCRMARGDRDAALERLSRRASRSGSAWPRSIPATPAGSATSRSSLNKIGDAADGPGDARRSD